MTDPVHSANWAVLAEDLAGELDANIEYLTQATTLGVSNVTLPEIAAQVEALTRQVDALIRLRIGALDTVDGT